MHRVNIMVEVSDEVYDLVVQPYKKSKNFKTLIERLLSGYLENETIAAYVEGSLDALKRSSLDSFNSTIESMKASMATMGMLTEEAEVTANYGKKVFGEGTNESSATSEVVQIVTKESKEDEVDETKILKEEVNSLKTQNAEIMRMIQSMSEALSGLQSNKVGESSVEGNESVTEEVKEDKVVENLSEKVITDEPNTSSEFNADAYDEDDPLSEVVSFDDDNVEIPMPEEEEEDDEDDDFLSGILEGQVYTF